MKRYRNDSYPGQQDGKLEKKAAKKAVMVAAVAVAAVAVAVAVAVVMVARVVLVMVVRIVVKLLVLKMEGITRNCQLQPRSMQLQQPTLLSGKRENRNQHQYQN